MVRIQLILSTAAMAAVILTSHGLDKMPGAVDKSRVRRQGNMGGNTGGGNNNGGGGNMGGGQNDDGGNTGGYGNNGGQQNDDGGNTGGGNNNGGGGNMGGGQNDDGGNTGGGQQNDDGGNTGGGGNNGGAGNNNGADGDDGNTDTGGDDAGGNTGGNTGGGGNNNNNNGGGNNNNNAPETTTVTTVTTQTETTTTATTVTTQTDTTTTVLLSCYQYHARDCPTPRCSVATRVDIGQYCRKSRVTQPPTTITTQTAGDAVGDGDDEAAVAETTVAITTSAATTTVAPAKSCGNVAEGSTCIPHTGGCYRGICYGGNCYGQKNPLADGSSCETSDAIAGTCSSGSCQSLAPVNRCSGEGFGTPCAAKECHRGVCHDASCKVSQLDVGAACYTSLQQAGTCGSVFLRGFVCTATVGEPTLPPKTTTTSVAPGASLADKQCEATPENSPCMSGVFGSGLCTAGICSPTGCNAAGNLDVCRADPCRMGRCFVGECMLGEQLSVGTGCIARGLPGVCNSVGSCESMTTTKATSFTDFPIAGLVDLLYRNRGVEVLSVSSEVRLSGVSPSHVISSASIQNVIITALRELVVAETGTLFSSVDVVLLPAQTEPALGETAAAYLQYGVVQRFPSATDADAVKALLSASNNIFAALKNTGRFQALSAVVVLSCEALVVGAPSTLTTTSVTTVGATTSAPVAAATATDNVASGSATALVILAALLFAGILFGGIYYVRSSGGLEMCDGYLPGFLGGATSGSVVLTKSTYDIPSPSAAAPTARSYNIRTPARARRSSVTNEPGATADDFVTARLPDNAAKNFSPDHLPYDHNRVVMLPLPGAANSDYINASFVAISSASGARQYIAAQSPLASTALDFWRMVLEQKVTVVALIGSRNSRGDPLFQYFPASVGENVSFGEITITLRNMNKEPGFVVRTLEVDIPSEPTGLDPELGRAGKVSVTHCQFVDFPATGTPQNSNSFLAFRAAVDKAASSNADTKVPVVVSCDNGCGRTGTFICLDAELQRYKIFGDMDLFDAVTTGRRSRAQLVETDAQYVFLHRAFVTELVSMDNDVSGNHAPNVHKYLAKFSVQGTGSGFDLGRAGRAIRKLGDFTMSRTVVGPNSQKEVQLDVQVAITTDCVVLTKSQGGKFVFVTACSREETQGKPQSKKDLGLKLIMRGGEQVLTCKTEGERAEWVALLNGREGFKPESALPGGERMINSRPVERSECLDLMGSPDPQTFEGSSSLKAEFESIPKHSSKNSPKKSALPGQNFSRSVMNPAYRLNFSQMTAGSPEAPLNPMQNSMFANRFQMGGGGYGQPQAVQGSGNVMYGGPPTGPRVGLGYPTLVGQSMANFSPVAETTFSNN